MTGPNLVSEKAAASLWCPFARVAAPDDGPTFNRLDAGRERGQQVDAVKVPRMACCIGSKCAAWRWQDMGEGESVIEAIKRRRLETGSSLSEAKAFVEMCPSYRRGAPPTLGFCGAAGAP